MNYIDDEKLFIIKKSIVYSFAALTLFLTVIYLMLISNVTFAHLEKPRLLLINIATIFFLLTCLLARKMFLNMRRAWLTGMMIGMIYLNACALEAFGSDAFKTANGILFVFFELAFAICFLWISKNNFGRFFHTHNIIVLSTYSLFMLSFAFSSYYIEIYNLPFYFDRGNFFTMSFSYCKVSLRYFFELPPDEYLDLVSILQFILGKIYEAVLIGGIATLVVKTVGSSKKEEISVL